MNDSSLSVLFWLLLMAADISAPAQQGENGNPDLPTQGNPFCSSCKAILCFLSLQHITSMSLPIPSLLSSFWLRLGYYSCYLSGQAFLSIHSPRICSHYLHHNTSMPLQFTQCSVEKLCLASTHWTSPPAALKALLILSLLIHHHLKINLF